MKKINNLELASLIFIQMVTMDLGININIIKNSTGVNGWIVIILSFIIGIIPLSLYMYISNFSTTHPLNEKINILFKKTGKIINFLISIISLVIGIFLLYNSNNFITSQLLYRTPQIMIGIILISLAIYHNSKGINSITKVSFLLLIINFTLFLLSFFSLSSNINISNLLPVLKENTDNIFLSALKLSSINIFPIIITLSIPKSLVSSENTYNKDIIKSIISLATKEINGVASMNKTSQNPIVQLIKGKNDNGVKVSASGDEVVVDVYINIFSDANVKEIAWRIQENIRTSVQSMMNIKVKAVNINIIDVDFSNLERE